MPSPNANGRYANGHRRRQVRAQVFREETHCALCGNPVDKSLPHGQPGSPELDEKQPFSLGGSPVDRANLQLAHRLCNQRRGNGLRNRQRRAVAPFTTTARTTP